MVKIFRKFFRKSKPAFHYAAAQKYEAYNDTLWMKEHFADLYESWERAKEKSSLFWTAHDPENGWFQGNETLWREFVAHIRPRKCLEIGCGPFGYLSPCYWIRDRVLIDPLIDFYRKEQLRIFGKTVFTSDIPTFAAFAEFPIKDLEGKVDGCIVCRNTLDHTEDPLAIIDNISEYAVPGCYLLIWSDLWHLKGLDEGHRNITRSIRAMDKLLQGMRFKILQEGKKIRDPQEYIEYGRVAVKT